MNVLMIANSFGVNLQTFASDIAKANGLDLDLYVLYIGGCSLGTHSHNIETGEAAYELFHNGASTHEMISLPEAMKLKAWDKISLQQASHVSGDISTYYPYMNKIVDYVRNTCPKAEIIYHKTWPYSSINSYKYETVPSFYPPFHFQNAEEMKKAIDDCTRQICQEFHITTVLNSGDVVVKAMKEIGDCYDGQGFHLNELGCYLIGANMIKVLFGTQLKTTFTGGCLGRRTCQNLVDFINANTF